MIRKLIICFCLLIAGVCNAQISNRLFPELKKQVGLSSVYVGKNMLNMARNLNIGIGILRGENLTNSLESVEVYEASTPNAVQALRAETVKTLQNLPGLEIAFVKEDDTEVVTIYTSLVSNGKYYDRLLIVSEDLTEFTVINLQGNIPVNVLENLNL